VGNFKEDFMKKSLFMGMTALLAASLIFMACPTDGGDEDKDAPTTGTLAPLTNIKAGENFTGASVSITGATVIADGTGALAVKTNAGADAGVTVTVATSGAVTFSATTLTEATGYYFTIPADKLTAADGYKTAVAVKVTFAVAAAAGPTPAPTTGTLAPLTNIKEGGDFTGASVSITGATVIGAGTGALDINTSADADTTVTATVATDGAVTFSDTSLEEAAGYYFIIPADKLTKADGYETAVAVKVTFTVAADDSYVVTGAVGSVTPVTTGVAAEEAISAVKGTWTLTVSAIFGVGENITLAGTKYTSAGGLGDTTTEATAIATALSGNTNYDVTSAAAVVTFTEKTGAEGTKLAPSATAISHTGAVGAVTPDVAGVEAVVAVQGTWTLTVAAKFSDEDAITVDGVTYENSGGSAQDAGAEAALIVVALKADSGYSSKSYTVDNADAVITFTQSVGGVGAKPVLSTTLDSGKIGSIVDDTPGVAAVTAVAGTWTIEVASVFAAGEKITLGGVEYTSAGSKASPTEEATAIASALTDDNGYSAGAFDIASSGAVITYTQKVGGTGVAPVLADRVIAGAVGVVTPGTTGVTGVPAVDAVAGTWTLTVTTPFAVGEKITITGVDYASAGSLTTTTEAAAIVTELQADGGYAAKDYTVASAAAVITFTEKTSKEGTLLIGAFTVSAVTEPDA
jgi:hypothetical protein